MQSACSYAPSRWFARITSIMDVAARLAALDWSAIEQSLWQHGYAKTPPVLTSDECDALVAMYGERERFRTRIVLERIRFGVGE